MPARSTTKGRPGAPAARKQRRAETCPGPPLTTPGFPRRPPNVARAASLTLRSLSNHLKNFTKFDCAILMCTAAIVQDMELDELDHAIIEQLRVDGRLSNVALADRVGLTPAPCLGRVQRLEAGGVLRGSEAAVSLDVLGRGFEVFL